MTHKAFAYTKYQPESKGLSKDWNTPLLTDIYETSGPCLNGDMPIITMKWKGIMPTCYGENIDFNDKRSNPEEAGTMEYMKGSCKENAYGNRKSCLKKDCIPLTEKR